MVPKMMLNGKFGTGLRQPSWLFAALCTVLLYLAPFCASYFNLGISKNTIIGTKRKSWKSLNSADTLYTKYLNNNMPVATNNCQVGINRFGKHCPNTNKTMLQAGQVLLYQFNDGPIKRLIHESQES